MVRLAENFYGKSRVRLLKVLREGTRHEVREWTVGVYLMGEFERCFTVGDNTGIMATDTMKNMVYTVARESTARTMEGYAAELAGAILEGNPQVDEARVTVEEKMWVPIEVRGEQHDTAFQQRGPEVATTELVLRRGGVPAISSGVKGLVILKTAGSAFRGFKRDAWTTLPELYDRLLATEAKMEWKYGGAVGDYRVVREGLMDTLLATFAHHESLSVQHTLYAMAEAALASEPAIAEISLAMPNRHNLLVDLGRFGQDNPNEIFVPTDEPSGHIFARVVRQGN